MGGESPEHEVSLQSGREVVRNFSPRKYSVKPLILPKKRTDWGRIIRQIKAFKPETVFIALHGPYGEDGTIQGLLELIGIPYTGAGVLASALGMDKVLFRQVMKAKGILVPKDLFFTKSQKRALIWQKFKPPVVVKPAAQGSSVGVSIVSKRDQLECALSLAFGYGKRILIEEYLPGTEVTVGVLGNERPVVLPVVEIVPKNKFFNYEAKYNPQKAREIVPARISRKLTSRVQALALKVYQAISCQGFGRVDMIICHNQPYVLEINTIPGLTPVSLFPKAASAAGISYPQLLDRLIELALEK